MIEIVFLMCAVVEDVAGIINVEEILTRGVKFKRCTVKSKEERTEAETKYKEKGWVRVFKAKKQKTRLMYHPRTHKLKFLVREVNYCTGQ